MQPIVDMEVQDLARLLVVPASRGPIPAAKLAAFHARLAPIEMSAPSLHLVSQAAQAWAGAGKSPGSADPVAKDGGVGRELPGYLVPVCYAGCGLALGLCNVLVPDGLVACAHVLCPVWTLGLGLHAAVEPDAAWFWLGFLAILLLPVTLLLHDALFLGLYLFVFAVFASGRFWQLLRGPAFALVCACWFGLATACASGLFVQHPRAQLAVATCFALAAGVVSSAVRFGRLRVTVSSHAK